MEKSLVRYRSCDGESMIRAYSWQASDVASPRGIVQIVHGMSEHIDRYDSFAGFLAERGFVVCANDHIGHGGSVSDRDSLGHIPLSSGGDALVEDVHELRRIMQDRFGSVVPYAIFGHSMGSFVTRSYLTRHGQGLSAAVLCGTGQQPRLLSRLGNAACHCIAALKGERYRSSFIDSLGAGAFSKAIDGARTDMDWLSIDPAVVDAYKADPLCGRMFTVGAYAALASLTLQATDASSASRIPHGLPMLFIAGDQDPVGDCGAGVLKAAEQYRAAGVDSVEVKLYEGLRHEILNEPSKRDVFGDVDAWLKSKGL